MKKNFRAFSLLELALILVVLGAIMTLGVGVLSSIVKNNKMRETESILEEVRESLVGYVMTNGRLPCPDADGDGHEDSSSGSCTCSLPDCFLPYVTINVRGSDAYGRKLYYNVDSIFTTFSTLRGFCVHAPYITPSIQVSGNSDCSSGYYIAAIVISGGRKDSDGDNLILDGENADNDSCFVQESVSISNNYDDFTKEISLAWLLSRACDTNLRKLKIRISGGNLCYNGNTYDSSHGYIFLGSGETIRENSCSGDLKTFDELRNIDWSGDRDGMIKWDGFSWSDD